MQIRLALLSLTLMTLLLTGCGYSLSRTSSAVGPATGCRVVVPMFVNETFEPLIEKDLTSAMKDELALDGRWTVTDREGADLSVTGRVTSFELVPLTYDAKERIQEYRIRVHTEIKVTDLKADKVLWKDSDMESFAEYRLTLDITKNKISREEAIQKASKKLADEFIIRVLDSF